MEPQKTNESDFKSETRQSINPNVIDEYTAKRLDALLNANAQFTLASTENGATRETFEPLLLKNPYTSEKVFSIFGLLLGLFPPAAFFLNVVLSGGGFHDEDSWIIGLMIFINVISGLVGYFSGKLVGKTVAVIEQQTWPVMLFLSLFVGLGWGIVTGGVAGIFAFVFGAIFGAIIGGAVGAAALPVFVVFHRLMKEGDTMDRDAFLPIAFGITFAICGAIMGF